MPDGFQYGWSFGESLVVPEAVIFQPSVSSAIVSPLFRVLTSIQFDNQFRFKTDKVDNVLAYGLLSSELETHKSSGAEEVPEVFFGFCSVCA